MTRVLTRGGLLLAAAVALLAASAGVDAAPKVRYTITPIEWDEANGGPYKPVSVIYNGDQVKWRITRSAIIPGKAFICFKLCTVIRFTGLTATAPNVFVTRGKFGPTLKVVVTDDANNRTTRVFTIRSRPTP